jgi:hypothetical protein
VEIANAAFLAVCEYPIYDENAYDAALHDEACRMWAEVALADRARVCKEAGISIFAARRDEIPNDDAIYVVRERFDIS